MSQKGIFKKMMKSGGNVPVVASIIVLIAFIGGLLLGTLVLAKSFSGKNVFISQMTGSFADGYNAAKKKIADAGLFPHQAGILNGQITGVSGDKVTFTAPLINPLDDASLMTRTAVVGKDTVITLYRLKTPDQIAADQKTGQKQMSDTQSQLNVLQTEMAKCGPPQISASSSQNGSDCATVAKNYAAALQALNQANQLMDQYIKVDKASMSDLQAGMQITVYGEQVKQTAAPAAAPAAIVNFADISEQATFNVSLIEARQTPKVPSPAIIYPPSPAATTSPTK